VIWQVRIYAWFAIIICRLVCEPPARRPVPTPRTGAFYTSGRESIVKDECIRQITPTDLLRRLVQPRLSYGSRGERGHGPPVQDLIPFTLQTYFAHRPGAMVAVVVGCAWKPHRRALARTRLFTKETAPVGETTASLATMAPIQRMASRYLYLVYDLADALSLFIAKQAHLSRKCACPVNGTRGQNHSRFCHYDAYLT
jgi:hypothetical protein